MKDKFFLQGGALLTLTLGLAWGYLNYFGFNNASKEEVEESSSLEDLTQRFALKFNTKNDVKEAVSQAKSLIQNVDNRVLEIKDELTVLEQKKDFLSKFVSTFSKGNKNLRRSNKNHEIFTEELQSDIENLEEKYGNTPVTIEKSINGNSTVATFYGDVLVQKANGKFVIFYDLADMFLDVVAHQGGPQRIRNLRIINSDRSQKKSDRLKHFINSFAGNLNLEIIEQNNPDDREMRVEIEFSRNQIQEDDEVTSPL